MASYVTRRRFLATLLGGAASAPRRPIELQQTTGWIARAWTCRFARLGRRWLAALAM